MYVTCRCQFKDNGKAQPKEEAPMNTTATAAVVTPFIDTVSDLLAHNRIPTLDAGQMSDFSRYLFTACQ